MLLDSGWSHAESEPSGGPGFRWGLEPRSELRFTLVEPRDLTLRIDARPRRAPAGSAQTVELEVNGRAAGRLALRPDRQEYRLPLGAELLLRGENQLSLRYELGPSAVAVARGARSGSPGTGSSSPGWRRRSVRRPTTPSAASSSFPTAAASTTT